MNGVPTSHRIVLSPAPVYPPAARVSCTCGTWTASYLGDDDRAQTLIEARQHVNTLCAGQGREDLDGNGNLTVYGEQT